MSALLVALALAQEPRTVTVDPGFELAGHRILDANGDARAEIVAIGRDGRVRTLIPLHADGAPAVQGELTLPAPANTLLDIATFGSKGYLVAETPAGTVAYALDASGRVASEGATWIPRGKFALRVGAPTFSGIVRDVNKDGTNDVVVPTLFGVELWLGTLEEGKPAPTFRKAATVAVEVARWGSHEAEDLSDSLEGSFSIPDLDTDDVNGDGRPDLLVVNEQRRGFHLQRADGSFPVEPDVALDLAIFRDTTEAAPIELGGTLSVGDQATYSARDLDGDDIPDYVIGHRRKVWVFRGGKSGPQFKQPSAILKTAEDITALVVLPLDQDERPDLLLLKVQIPTLATLLRGLFGEWDVQIRALAYSNLGEGKFATSPSMSNELSVRLPGIIGLIKNPEKVVQRFEDLEKRFRKAVWGDLDGNGAEDVLLVTEDKKAIEVWYGAQGDQEINATAEAAVREVLFDDQNRVWDIDRVVGALGSFAQRQVALITGGRPPDLRLPLRDPAEVELVQLECADFDGDRADEITLAYKKRGERRSGWFEVTAVQRGGGGK